MSMIGIRDDDTSYWTSVDDLRAVYDQLIDRGVKISLAVVPDSYKLVNPGDRTKFYIIEEHHEVYQNSDLVNYLIPLIKRGAVEIMMHGYDHSYYVNMNDCETILNLESRIKIGNNIPNELIPECIYKSEQQLSKELMQGKQILEDTFQTKVNTFVPPSNALSVKAASIVEKLGMNISGTITNKINRKMDVFSLMVIMKKLLWKLKGNEISYPFLMKYKDHTELVGHALTPSSDFQKLIMELKQCISLKCDFVLATHYWELLSNTKLNDHFNEFIIEVDKAGLQTACLNELLTK